MCKPFLASSRLAGFAALFLLVGAGTLSSANARGDRDQAVCSRGDGEDRIAACGRILDRGGRESEEKRAAAYVNRAFVYNTRGDYDLAVHDLDDAIVLNPRNSVAFNNRGFAFERKGDPDRAIRDYDEAVRINPKNTVALVNRSNAYRTKADYDRAIRDLDDVLQIEPRNAFAINGRGLAYKGKGDLDRAIRDFDEALRLSPKDSGIHSNRGDAFREKNDYDRAIQDYDEAVRINPNDWYSNYGRGLADLAKGENERAVRDLDESIRINPKAAIAFNTRGFIYRMQGDYERAIRDLDEALRINPKFAAAYSNRGEAWRRRGDMDRALADLNEGIRLDPTLTPAYVNRGLAYEKRGDIERAKADYDAALKRPPGNYTTTKASLETARERLAALSTATAPVAALPSPDRPATAAGTSQDSPRGPRVALVIGNGAYTNVTSLPNPPNDARDMAGALRDLGFKVIEGYNLDSTAMRGKIEEFGAALPGAGVSLLYYAGHGMQVAGKNYLIPVDAKLERPSSLGVEAIEVSTVISDMEAEKRVNLVFLDACRDNPLSRTLARSLGASRSASVGQGLAQLNAGIGTLITFATSPDTVALDGSGKNSPFTAAMLRYIRTPGLEIRSMLTRVRADVIRATNEQQVPWDHSSLTGDFYFKPGS
ncbi:MAG TPA: tetratricopeptide repeat protein [Bradyrhizobium sp.]|uniref:tetratricopeptide repeat protein n=1 Tax=Bradyrhizobium sp. TaxID=376 RepID=UPI002B987EE6|nr:tetratricopeptide repeat protein [Bradyrhizobium sp.]HTB01482.1 tetratricopeptide repeat protein [Bradyrhizobium sp.]